MSTQGLLGALCSQGLSGEGTLHIQAASRDDATSIHHQAPLADSDSPALHTHSSTLHTDSTGFKEHGSGLQ